MWPVGWTRHLVGNNKNNKRDEENNRKTSYLYKMILKINMGRGQKIKYK